MTELRTDGWCDRMNVTTMIKSLHLCKSFKVVEGHKNRKKLLRSWFTSVSEVMNSTSPRTACSGFQLCKFSVENISDVTAQAEGDAILKRVLRLVKV